MKLRHTKVNFKDKRGEIRDILTYEDVDAITYLTSAKGAVRGNHYHEHTMQWEYVLSGSFKCYARQGLKGKVQIKTISAGDLVEHPIGECHALKALEDSELLSFTKGPRRGREYEQDVVRLDKPLVT